MHNGHARGAPGTPSSGPPRDRRRPPDEARDDGWRWLQGLMRRPFKLGWRRGLPRLMFVERRRTPAIDPELRALRADLRAELLALADGALSLGELLRVDEALGAAGWPGLRSLPGRVVARAAMQAEMLAESSASQPLALLAVRLRALQQSREAPAADVGEAATTATTRPARRAAAPPTPTVIESVEVLELSEDAYAEAEQLWAASRPAALPPGEGPLKA